VELIPNLQRPLVLDRPGLLPEVADNRFFEFLDIVTLQCFPEFSQKLLPTLLSGKIDRSLAAPFFAASYFSNLVLVRNHPLP
jgi:hypothetical protein